MGELYSYSSYGLSKNFTHEIQSFKIGEGLPGIVVQNDQSLVINNINEDPRFLRIRGNRYGLNHALGIPLKSRNKTIGVLNFFNSDGKAFVPELIFYLETIGKMMGTALDRFSLKNPNELKKS